jgi:hypothetical protein
MRSPRPSWRGRGARTPGGRRVRFIAAWFRSEDEILGAARDVRAAGFEVHDAYTPYPVHGLDDAVGLRRSHLTRVALIGSMLGLAIAVGLQLWVSLVDWPMNIGGKPNAPLALFVPVAFELTVLIGGLSTVAAFLVLARLRPGARKPLFEGATDDRFVLVLRQEDGTTDTLGARRILEHHRAITVLDGVEAA